METGWQTRGQTAATCARRAKTERGARAYHAGLAAEDSVARYYRQAGCDVAERRWRGAAGEIDLVAHDGDAVVFVEVKKAKDFAIAAERVTRRQIERILRAASEYLSCLPAGQATETRFDVALVDAHGAVQILESAITA